MGINEQYKAILLQFLDEVGPEKLALACLAAVRQIDADTDLMQTCYMRDGRGKYGGPYRIAYDVAADTLYNVGAQIWKAFIATKEV